MALFSALIFLTLPGSGSGSFVAFYGLYGAVPHRRARQRVDLPDDRDYFPPNHARPRQKQGGTDEQAQHEAVTETAAALGFISAIGAVGGFFIPKAFGTSLAMTGSPVGAMKVFLVFYIVCVLVTAGVWPQIRKTRITTRPKQEKCHEQTVGSLSLFQNKGDSFANGHGQVYNTNRDWEDGYRQRWQFDKIVRSTHGVNCTGSCSWKIYVKTAS